MPRFKVAFSQSRVWGDVRTVQCGEETCEFHDAVNKTTTCQFVKFIPNGGFWCDHFNSTLEEGKDNL